MTATLGASDVNRRAFINGRWSNDAANVANGSFEIASILVQCRPERLEAAARTIASLPGAQVYSCDPIGKLVVVLEAYDVGAIGSTLNSISMMPDVVTAALVFHATEQS